MLMNIACDVKFEVESKTSSCLHELYLGFRLQLSRKASVIQLMKVQESSREKNHPRCQRRLIKQVPVAASLQLIIPFLLAVLSFTIGWGFFTIYLASIVCSVEEFTCYYDFSIFIW